MNQTREHEERYHRAEPSPASEVDADVDRALHRRVAREGTWGATAEDRIKRRSSRIWHGLKERPSIGVIVAGGAALLLADAIGVGELAMAVGLGYGAYRVLRKGKRGTEETAQAGEEKAGEATKSGETAKADEATKSGEAGRPPAEASRSGEKAPPRM